MSRGSERRCYSLGSGMALPPQDSVADLWVGAHFGSLGEGERWLVS